MTGKEPLARPPTASILNARHVFSLPSPASLGRLILVEFVSPAFRAALSLGRSPAARNSPRAQIRLDCIIPNSYRRQLKLTLSCSRPLVLLAVVYVLDSFNQARYHMGMSAQLGDPGINACVEALSRAGLELHEQAEEEAGKSSYYTAIRTPIRSFSGGTAAVGAAAGKPGSSLRSSPSAIW
jgi:hypothetical protein